MWQKYYSVFCIVYLKVDFCNTLFDNEVNLKCYGKKYENVTLTAYFPEYDNEEYERGYKDVNGNVLCTLQDYVDDRNEYVTVSMDENLNIPYGTSVCIPELNDHLGHRIRLQIRDTSSDVLGTGYKRAEICVRSEVDSYDINYNRQITLVFV